MRTRALPAMRAQLYTRYGGPEVLELRRDLPEPTPEAHEVLVEVQASAVNPVDWKLRRGNLRKVVRGTLPMVPGRDFCGLVIACGARATSVARGDRVFGLCGLRGPGSHADRVCVGEQQLALAPTRPSASEVAALPLAGLTALQAVEAAAVRPEQRVLVQGGAGSVGALAVQYAVHLGARVYATTSAANLDYVRSLGAEPIDYRRDRFEDQLHGLDAVIDCVGGDVERRSFAVLRRGGKLVTVAGPDPDAVIDVRTILRLGVSAPPRLVRELARGHRYQFVSARTDHRDLVRLAKLVDSGVLVPRIDPRALTLEQLAEAHRISERGGAQGKLVLDHLAS